MILDFLKKNSKITFINESNNLRVSSKSDNFNIYTIASDFKTNGRMIFVVLPTLFEVQRYYDALTNLVDSDSVLFFPVDEMISASLLIASKEFKYERINTLISLLDGKNKIVVTNINGILKANMPKEEWMKNILFFEEGKTYDINTIKKRLVDIGYTRANLVTQTGEFSARGSIIDIFPLNYDMPVRLDFFDDELESIKVFDTDSQKSKHKINSASVPPLNEIIFNDEKKDEVIDRLKSLKSQASYTEVEVLEHDIERIDMRQELEVLSNYISFFCNPQSILSFVNDDSIMYMINEDKLKNIAFEIEQGTEKYFDDLGSVVLRNYSGFLKYNDVMPSNVIYLDSLVDHEGSYECATVDIPPYYGDFVSLGRNIGQNINKSAVILAVTNVEKLGKLKGFFQDNFIHYKTIDNVKDIDKSCVNIINEYALTLYMPVENMFILSEDIIFSLSTQKTKVNYKSVFTAATRISKFDELKPGDYIVHSNHGIGIYEGIKTLELAKKKRDYLSLCYANNEHVYIPIEQLKQIKRYTGQEGNRPNLTKLGTNSWAKAKQNVKAKVMELGQQLVELYAKREATKGFSFDKDTEEQYQFEQEFPYELTLDQQKAIEAVKADMESDKTMDRLICGDVGFGKTEVALRASFKAVMSGKQVCYLAPTTVLTRQHYHTFKDRMEKYGIRVELLNRFKSQKEIKQILKDLEFGSVDVIIGTHRVLSDDVKFKDLGLLITDEEQRFGVLHKEKIKAMKINVDSLMLTATPIPRTLQMSLVGIKELSTIETPPKNRYPVQTYVTPRMDSLIRDAIERELLRGGQVFYLYNFTDDIADVETHIHRLVPDARICYAHGKMNKYELEDIISDFIDHKYDVLISTTIIETGIDIPEANTLIIHDADRLGLSQLYQIRGRVGRSDKIAYAYLMYQARKVLTEDAEKRLAAIKEFTELGSGFKIAMRDLAIRGAGDLLGEEQSGFINTVGLDTYMDILEETLKELKGEVKPTPKPTVNIKDVISNRYIPSDYELTEDLKIEIHKKISEINSITSLQSLIEEFNDRFGPVNEELETYMYEKLFSSLCNQTGVEDVKIMPRTVTIKFRYEVSQKMNGEKVYKAAYQLSRDFTMIYHNSQISCELKTQTLRSIEWMKLFCQYLTDIQKD